MLVVIADQDAGQFLAVLRLQHQRMVTFLDGSVRIEHRFDKVIQRGARADRGQVRPHFPPHTANGVATDTAEFGPAVNGLAARRVALDRHGRGDLANLSGRQGHFGILKPGAPGEREDQLRLVATAFAGDTQSGLCCGSGKTAGRQRARQRAGGSFDVEQRAPKAQRVVFVCRRREDADGEWNGLAQVERGQGEHGFLADHERLFAGAKQHQGVDDSSPADLAQTVKRNLAKFRRGFFGFGDGNQPGEIFAR